MAYTVGPFRERYLKFRLSDDERLGIYEKIASFLDGGVDLHTCLIMLSSQYSKAMKGDRRVDVLKEWAEAIGAGTTFSEALEGWVPSSEAMIIKAGERSGSPADAMRSAIDVTRSAKEMKSAVTSQAMYPVLLIIALLAIIYNMSTSMLPVFAEVLPVEQWPDSSRKLYEVGNFIVEQINVIVFLLVSLAMFISWSMPKIKGEFRSRYLDKIPPWSFYRIVQSSSLLIALSAMVKGGKPFNDALEEMKSLSTPYMKHEIDKMLTGIMTGVGIGTALNQGLLSKETGVDVEIYGELNRLKDVMDVIGENDIKNGIKLISAASSLLKNIVLAMIAFYLMWLMMSMQQIQTAMNAALSV